MNLLTQINALASLAMNQTTDAGDAMQFANAANLLAQAMATVEAIPTKQVDEAAEIRAVGLRVVAFRVEALRLKGTGMDRDETYSRLLMENLNLEYKGSEFEITGIVNSVFYKKLD
jgi:hypothetical protein